MPMYVTIQEEKFEMSITSVLASFSAESLRWAPAANSCVGSQHTYIWQQPQSFDCTDQQSGSRTCASMQACPYIAGEMAASPVALTSAACYPRYLAQDLSVSYPTL